MFRLLCFGYPRVEGPDGRNLEELQDHPKRFAVLIYLACHSEVPVCQRDSVLPVFWPEVDEPHARNSLRQTLHVLKTCLGDEVIRGGTGGEVRIDGDKLTSDVGLFCTALREGKLAEALALPTEPFLNDFSVPDATPFMDWLDQRRRSLNEKAVYAATRLARNAEADRSPHRAVPWWRRALDLSPYDEGLLTHLVWALTDSGNRGGALTEYRRFRSRLKHDLDLEPSPATRMAVGEALGVAGSDGAGTREFTPPRTSRRSDSAGASLLDPDGVLGLSRS